LVPYVARWLEMMEGWESGQRGGVDEDQEEEIE